PEPTQTSVINDSTISISFSEPVDSLTATTYTNYSIDNSIGYPKSISINLTDFSSVTLTINSLQSSIIYTITLNNIQDCSGNIISANTELNIGLPDKIDSLDLVINEVLFNPFTGGSDFVEIYNRSQKILNLNDLILAETDANGNIDNAYDVTSSNSLIFPDEYVALTKDVSHLKSNYTIMDANAFIEMSSTPSYDDDEGTVVITDSSGNKIDQFSYTDDMHFALLDDDNGVSLERIDPERKTNDVTNWNSAASTAGYATPGYENSQLIPTTITSSNISVNPEVFSPDNDGFNDVVNISYKFTESSYVGNVYIYNARGQYITQILKNETLNAEGTISWDGINDNEEKAQIGIYVIYFEVFDLSGNVQKFKTSCVLGGKL
ncbi:MAG: lamin tail domain-containing protein, partial [Deltaproteobacteria bacterium]|nr:lamin tail domain-containing protein [Deltaproteobacteria bacterium]